MTYRTWEDVKPQKGKQELVMKMIQNQEVDFMLCGGARAGGKVMPYSEPVQTPWGEKTHGDMEVGSVILNPDGTHQKVVAVYPHKDWAFYRILFEDGSSCEAGLEHKWLSWKEEGASYEGISPTEAVVLTTYDLRVWLAEGYSPCIPVVSKNSPYKRVVSIEFSRLDDGCCIEVDHPNHLYLVGDFTVTHNSELLSMMPLLFSDDPQYRGIFFRRQYDEIMGANGLWDKAKNMYPLFQAYANKTEKTWTFPSKAIQEYRHMYNDGDEQSHRGKGYSLVGFDEIDQFTPAQVRMLMTCLRSEAKMDSFCVGTLNPNPDSWCLPLVEYYLNKDGSPNEDRCGEVRWYVLKNDEFLFGPSEQWFIDNHPETVYVLNENTGEKTYTRPKRFTYVFFNVFDNPAFLQINPAYLSELNNLPAHEVASQLYGNWYTREKGKNFFRISWLEETEHIPIDGICVRAWDKAYSDNIPAYPDFTASVKMYKDSNGIHYLCGDYKEDLTDDFKKGEDVVYGRFRKLAGQRDAWMLAQAEEDGDDCIVVIPEESGAGKGEYQQMVKMFTSEGFKVKGVKTGNVKGAKLKRFSSFTSAAQNGIIKIVPSSFGNIATYNAFVKELENFTGERSTGILKDDWVDAVSDAFAACQGSKTHRAVAIPTLGNKSRTPLSSMRQSMGNNSTKTFKYLR